MSNYWPKDEIMPVVLPQSDPELTARLDVMLRLLERIADASERSVALSERVVFETEKIIKEKFNG